MQSCEQIRKKVMIKPSSSDECVRRYMNRREGREIEAGHEIKIQRASVDRRLQHQPREGWRED
jgi:hypothetical protein